MMIDKIKAKTNYPKNQYCTTTCKVESG